MAREILSRQAFNRVNALMRDYWTNVLQVHFGSEVEVGPWNDLPPGQVFLIEGSTCVGDNAVLEREITCFTFNSPEYHNPSLVADRFFEINKILYDELVSLIESPLFDAARECLAKELYGESESDIVHYHITVDAFLKDARGSRRGLRDGLILFSVNSRDPSCYQIDEIGCGHLPYVRRAFVSHTATDKPRLQRILAETRNAGIATWVDEAELKAGDSLTEKIGAALEATDVVFAVISRASVQSRWVQKELNVAGALEVQGVTVKVVPLLLDRVPLPPLLADKVYVDLSDKGQFLPGCAKLLRAADAQFWRMHKKTSYRQALNLQRKVSGWHLPDIREAVHARSGMICARMKYYNDPIWTNSSPEAGKVHVVAGIKTRVVASTDCSLKCHCIFVPTENTGVRIL